MDPEWKFISLFHIIQELPSILFLCRDEVWLYQIELGFGCLWYLYPVGHCFKEWLFMPDDDVQIVYVELVGNDF